MASGPQASSGGKACGMQGGERRGLIRRHRRRHRLEGHAGTAAGSRTAGGSTYSGRAASGGMPPGQAQRGDPGRGGGVRHAAAGRQHLAPRAASAAATASAASPTRVTGPAGNGSAAMSQASGVASAVAAPAAKRSSTTRPRRVSMTDQIAPAGAPRRQGGDQRLPGGDAQHRQAGRQRDALGQGEGRADAGEAARPDHRGDRIEVGRGDPGLPQQGLHHGRQGGGMAALAVQHAVGTDLAIRQQGGGAAGERGVEGEDPHGTGFLSRSWRRVAHPIAHGSVIPWQTLCDLHSWSKRRTGCVTGRLSLLVASKAWSGCRAPRRTEPR